MDELFIFLGRLTFCAVVFLTIYCVDYFISIGVNELCWRYKYKHRFDKKPIAKCYCIDCSYHDKNNRCSNLSVIDGPSYYTADNWFCWQADPRKNNQQGDLA